MCRYFGDTTLVQKQHELGWGQAWHWVRGFSALELEQATQSLARRNVSGPISEEDAQDPVKWRHYYSEAVIAREPPGSPEVDGAFERACSLIEGYEFSDPRVVRAHFDASAPLLGRRMLLDLRVLSMHLLCGVAVGSTRNERLPDRSVFAFRYDTLQGHPEAGSEWFSLIKDHHTGSIIFRIQAAWRQGDLPNWWMQLGFRLLARPYQRAWHRLAYLRLRAMVSSTGLPSIPVFRLLQRGYPPVVAAGGGRTMSQAEHHVRETET